VLRTTNLESQHADADIHGIGEMTLSCVALALANALYDALGFRIHTLPLTAERILRALQSDA
jgi:CO/xanthine dehydrogenase Mo-binding subunit